MNTSKGPRCRPWSFLYRAMTVNLLLMPTHCTPSLAANTLTIKRLDGTAITSAEVDRTVTRLMDSAEVTGVGIALFNDGKPVYVKAYGLRDRDKRLPLTENSVMSGASVSKAAFSYLVMQLVEEGHIAWMSPGLAPCPSRLPNTRSTRTSQAMRARLRSRLECS